MGDAESILNQGGLYMDEFSRNIRLVHPESERIIAECNEYFKITTRCSESAQKFNKKLKLLADQANSERLEVVCRRSQLLHENTDGSIAYGQLKGVLQDKNDELDRLRQYLESLFRVEKELKETLSWLSNK